MTTISEILGCPSKTNKRRKLDAYPTPPWATEALVRVEAPYWNNTIWEPCSGDGNISKVLREAGFDVVESELARGTDFLKTTTALAPLVITNPPYGFATEFILHAHKLGVRYHAWLLKADFFNARRAFKLIDAVGYPARIWALPKRPDFTAQGSPPMNVSWFVFDERRHQQSAFELLSIDEAA